MSVPAGREPTPEHEHLKLTSYFGERDRHAGELVADGLLTLYGERRIAGSVLLRGTAGFGYKHHLRTDRLLTVSEDLPAVAIAVDTRARIEGLLEPVAQIQRQGLVTIERVSNLTASIAADARAAKLTIYLDRHERIGRQPAFAAVCALLRDQGVMGASALLGVDGTKHGHRRRARFLARNAHVPMMIVAVGACEHVARVLPALQEQLVNPLLTLERVRVCKRDGQRLEPPHTAADAGAQVALWQKLTVVSSEGASWKGRPLHLELIRRLRGAGAAGATSLRGIWGFHGEHAPHGDRLLSLRRHVPVFTIVLDTPERIARFYPIVDELTRERGLVTSELARTSIVTPSIRGCSSVG